MDEITEVPPETLRSSGLEPRRYNIAQGKFSELAAMARISETHELHKEAVDVFVGLIRDISAELETHPAWQMEVLDETGKPIFRLKLLGELLA